MKFKAGMITGAVIGALSVAGAGYALSDRHARKKITRAGRRVVEKTSDALDSWADKM